MNMIKNIADDECFKTLSIALDNALHKSNDFIDRQRNKASMQRVISKKKILPNVSCFSQSEFPNSISSPNTRISLNWSNDESISIANLKHSLSSSTFSEQLNATPSENEVFLDELYQAYDNEVNFSDILAMEIDCNLPYKINLNAEKAEKLALVEQNKRYKSHKKLMTPSLEVIPTIIFTPSVINSNLGSHRQRQQAQSIATRGVVLDYMKNKRMRTDPVTRWHQYQKAWEQDKFLNHQNTYGRNTFPYGVSNT